MKKRLTAAIAASMSLVLGLSLIGCNDDSDPDDIKTEGVTAAQWKAAFEKSDSFDNRTLTLGYTSVTKLFYNGEELTESTILGDGMTGADILEYASERLGESSDKTDYLWDGESSKLNIVSTYTYSGGSGGNIDFYRINGANIEMSYFSDHWNNDEYESIPEKRIYGPYKDAATAKALLFRTASLKDNLKDMEMLDKDGKPFNLINDYHKITYKNGAYTVEMSIEGDMSPMPVVGIGTVTLTDDYVSSIEFDGEVTVDAAEFGMPEGMTMEISVVANIGITDIDTTVVSDDGMAIATEDNTYHSAVVATESQFKSLFPSLDGGVAFRINNRRENIEYWVELKATADNEYKAYVQKNVWDPATERTTYIHTYYIASASGIQKYEGQNEYYFGSWGEPINVSSSGTFEALVALMPPEIVAYFATYDDGKTIADLYSMFEYSYFDTLSANLKKGNTTVEVTVRFFDNGGNFLYTDITIGDKEIDSIGVAENIDKIDPRTYMQ
ncbi:MAG: hypothetical protein J1G01_06740 [Clostridiales bacterium]|nr:hypothetical protein [Clostridiales bacterium]